MPYTVKGTDIYKKTTSGRLKKVGHSKTAAMAKASVRARMAAESGTKMRNSSRKGA